MGETGLAGAARFLASGADLRLAVGCYRLQFTSDASVHFSNFPGSAWRGALGHSLGRLTVDELERFGARLEPFLVKHELCATGCGQLAHAVDNGQVRA